MPGLSIRTGLGSGATRGETGKGHYSLPLVLDAVHVGQHHRAISVQFVEGIGDFRERPLSIRNALSREESEAAGGLRVDFRGASARLLLIPYEDRQESSAGLVQPLNPRGEVGFQRPPEHGKRLVGRHFWRQGADQPVDIAGTDRIARDTFRV